MNWIPGPVALMLLAALCACAEDIPLPPVSPLAAEPSTIQDLYGAREGKHKVVVAKDLVLPARGELRALPLNLYYPQTGAGYPLLIFSHGNWSDKDSYDLIIKHWVSHGYVVIAADHLDCCSMVKGIINSLRYGQLGLIKGRVEDVNRLLDDLDTLAVMHPDFATRADAENLGIAGHSFGAFTAQQFGGAGTLDPDTGQYLYFAEPAVKAIVALSPPGPMFDTITEGSWAQLSTPNLVTTGTWDIEPTFWPDWRLHLMSYDSAPGEQKFALVTEGADHYFGNLICRLEREEEPQNNALTMANIASTAFLDAFLKGDAQARAFIEGTELATATGGFSRLQHSQARAD